MVNNLILKYFNKFKLYKDNKELKFTHLEEQILNFIDYEEKGNYLFITPKDNDYFLIISIVYNALKMCYHNIFQDGNDILDIIKPGDILQYNKLLCRLKEKNDTHIVLEFRDGVYYLPVEFRYKLSKYNGSAIVLNKMQNKVIKIDKKTKNLLAEIMNINIDEICKVSKKSILIIENKSRINELIKSLYIKVGDNEKVALTEVFPMAYYSSVDNVYHYRGNANKGEPIVKFTSKIYIANELCKNIKNINSILFLPKKISNDDLSDLKEIERKKNINKVVSIITPLELERQIGNQYIHEDFFVKDIAIDIKDSIETSSFNRRQFEYYKNYINKNIQVKVMQNNNVSNLRTKINKSCSILSKLFINDDEIIRFIIIARKLTKKMVSIPIPLEAFDKIVEVKYPLKTIKHLMNTFEQIYNEILTRNFTSENKKNILKVFDLVKEVYFFVDNENLKWNELKSIIMYSNTKIISIVNDDKMIRDSIRYYIRKLFPNKKNIEVNSILDNDKQRNLVDITVFTGLLEDNMYNNYLRYNSKLIICLFYKFENQFLKFLKQRYISFYGIINEEKNSEKVLSEEEIYKEFDTEQDVYKELDIEIQLEELTTISYINHLSNNISLQGTNECCKVLKFTDGRKAFITKQFNAYELKENKEEILIKKPNELMVGQILVFLDDIEKDIVDSTMKALLCIKEIKDVYEIEYNHSKRWKSILKNYMEINKYTYNDLEKELKANGIVRKNVTIRNWILDSIVGPQEKEVYSVLAKITGDKYFLSNYDKIYESCNIIRCFQVKIRKAIAKSLLRIKSRDDNDEIDNIIMDNCSGLFNNVIKVEISKIYDKKIEIPCYLTNTVLED